MTGRQQEVTDGIRNPVAPDRRLRGVLFDMDGTLYRQGPLRSLMALELLTMPFSGPMQAPKRWKALGAYRRAQESLREQQDGAAASQVDTAAKAAGLPREEVESLVQDWMLTRPLKYLRFFRAAGVESLLSFLESRGVKIGLLSDYPAAGKIRALGLEGRFEPVLCATDASIGRFKPDPRGFLRACEIWQLAPSDVLAVGDRIDVDGAGAASAGMPCVIIGRAANGGAPGILTLPSFERLRHVLADQS